ncbi:hypothetical protein B0H14DRAFT_3554527 [Mycena olivaceomarginata]|nr:hypothetical protein B0H14DRAFT_3554527 [Mycena olivaceomarginata]
MEDIAPKEAIEDVRLFVQANLKNLPRAAQDEIVAKSLGLFIYAATIPISPRIPTGHLPHHSSTDPNKSDCARQDCHRKVSPACSHSRCKTHCIVDKGGCLAVGHQATHLTTRQAAKNHPRAAAKSRPSSSPIRPPISSPHSLSPTITPRPSATQQGLIYDPQLEEMQDLIQDEGLRQYFDPQPPPIEPMTAQEEQELELEMRLSKATYEARSSSTSSSSSAGPSRSSAGPSRSSSVGSFTAPSHSAPISSLSTHSHPVGMLKPVYTGNKVPSSTTPAPPRLSQPKKTTQMSASWMREYKDQTAADAAAIKRGKYKSALDLLGCRTSTLYVSKRPPIVKPINVIPHWDLWAIGDFPDLLAYLDIDTDVLEWFDHTRLKLWVEVALDYQHKLTSVVSVFADGQDLGPAFQRFATVSIWPVAGWAPSAPGAILVRRATARIHAALLSPDLNTRLSDPSTLDTLISELQLVESAAVSSLPFPSLPPVPPARPNTTISFKVSGPPDSTVAGPLHAAAFSYLMREYPNQDFVRTLAAICRHGAAFGYRGHRDGRTFSRNIRATPDEHAATSADIATNLRLGELQHVADLPDDLRSRVFFSPIGSVPNLEVVVAPFTTFPTLITTQLMMEFCHPTLL